MEIFGKRCSLCGGKLNGSICKECGLDNSKNDEKYVLTGSSHERNTKLTHTHTETEDPFAGKMVTKDWVKKAKETKKKKENSYQSNSFHKEKPEKKKRILLWTMVILGLIWLLPILFGLVQVFFDAAIGGGSHSLESEWTEEEWEKVDPYAYVQYELSEMGESYEEVLVTGIYKGGVHIPEGIYQIQYFPDEEAEWSSIDLLQDDYANGIYQNITFEDTGDRSDYEDFRVYTGSILTIEGRGTLRFISENAQPLSYEQNPNTESYVVEDAFVSGVDIVPGVYDVYCIDGSGIFDFTVKKKDGYEAYQGKLMGDAGSGFSGIMKNVVLPEGTEVFLEGMEVRLVPSEYIESQDYLGFYDEY